MFINFGNVNKQDKRMLNWINKVARFVQGNHYSWWKGCAVVNQLENGLLVKLKVYIICKLSTAYAVPL